MNIDFDYPELRKEKALAKIVTLFESGFFVSHTNIAKEFGIGQDIMRRLLIKQPNNLFAEIKAQNKQITLGKEKSRHITRDFSKKNCNDFDKTNFCLLKELRKKAKVVVKLANESDFDFKLFKSKAVGGQFPKEYKGSFTEYVCGVNRKQITY